MQFLRSGLIYAITSLCLFFVIVVFDVLILCFDFFGDFYYLL